MISPFYVQSQAQTAAFEHIRFIQWHSIWVSTTSGTQISISPDSILSTVANIPYDISDHICDQNLNRTTDICQL